MKKLNKFFAVLVALAMMATLCVSMAFAGDGTISDEGTQAPDATNANLVKYLQVPDGVTAPSKTFTFTFTKVKDSANPTVTEQQQADAETTTMPAIAETSITPGTTGDTAGPTSALKDGNSIYGYKSFDTILDDVDFDHAGVYTYRVSEKIPAVNAKDPTIKYDEKNYLIHIYVENGTDGEKTITHITGEEESSTPGVGTGDKVNMTTTDPVVKKGGEGEDKEDAKTGSDGKVEVEGLTFTNVYTKNNTGDSKYGVLSVEKTVTAKTVDNDASFPFEMTIIAPTGHEGETFVATLWSGDSEVTEKKTVDGIEQDVAVTVPFVDGTPKTFYLKNGQYLKFESANLPAGASYTVSEKLATATAPTEEKPTGEGIVNKKDKYNPSYKLTTSDYTVVETENVTKSKENKGAAGTNLGIEDTILIREDSAKELAAFTNAFDDELDTPTGILISNLPYIALALVAIGGLVAYVVVRRRNADEA